MTVDRALPAEQQHQGFQIHFGTASGPDPAGSPLALPPSSDVLIGRGAISEVNGDGFDDLTVTLFAEIPRPRAQRRQTIGTLLRGSPPASFRAPKPPFR